MIQLKTYYILLFLYIINRVVGNVYYIAPSYSAQLVPRGYQPPPFGTLVDKNNNYYKNQNQLFPQQEYTIMKFNEEPSKVSNQQFQVQHKLNQNHEKQLFYESESTTQKNQFQQKPKLQNIKNTQFKESVNKYNDIIPEEQNKFNNLQKKILNHERHYHHPTDPILINTLIQIFVNDSSEHKELLTESSSINTIKNLKIYGTITNDSHHILLSKKLDTKTYTFLPQNEVNETNDKNRFVSVKAFAATNSSKISKNKLKSELNRELQSSIPLIIEELDQLQKKKSTILSTTPVSFYTTSKIVDTYAHHKNLIESELKTKDLLNLIEEGLDEIDKSIIEKNDSLTTPLIVFSKTTAISQHQQQINATLNNFRKSIILTSTLSNYLKNKAFQSNEDKIYSKKNHSITFAPVTKFFKINKLLPVDFKENNKTIKDTDTNFNFFVNNTDFSSTISFSTNNFTSISINKTVNTNSNLLNSSEIFFLKKLNNSNNTFADIKKTTTFFNGNFNSSLSQLFNSSFENLINSTKNMNIVEPLFTPKNIDISKMPIIISTSSKNQNYCKEKNDNNKIRGDILFLIDSSDSIGNEKFKYAVKLVYDTVKNLGKNFGLNGIQISLIQFNQEPILEFSFRGHKCLENVLENILSIKYMMGASNLNHAIKKAMKCAFTKNRGDRSDVDNIIVLITSSQIKKELDLLTELTESNNTTMLVITTADEKLINLSKLFNNSQQNIFYLTKKESNNFLAQRLADRIREVLTDKNQNLLLNEKVKTQLFESFTKSNDVFFTYTTEQSNINNFNNKKNSINLKIYNQSKVPVSTINFFNDLDVLLEVNCLAKGILAKFALPNYFKGLIVAKGFETDSNCVTKVESINNNQKNIIQYVVVEIHYPHCGLDFVKSEFPRGINESIVLSVIHSKQLKTSIDQSFIINCFIPLFGELQTISSSNASSNNQLETNLNVIPTMALSKTISIIGTPPKCYYSLRRDSPNGPVLKEAQIGQIIYHRWECNNEKVKIKDEIMAYGLHVYNCYANSRSDKNNKNSTLKYNNTSFQYVNEAGCSTDDFLLNKIIYDENQLLAYAKSYVFTLNNVNELKFSCKISLCVRDNDGCEGYSPPICQSTSNMSDSLLLTSHQLRQKDLSIEAALSSLVETPRLAVLASKTFNSDNSNKQAHLNKFVTFENGFSKNSLSLTFIICFLFGALFFGAILGFFCFYILRFLNRLSLDDDDEKSLVNSIKNLNNSNFNFYKCNNDNLFNKLSFTSFEPSVTKNNNILPTFKETPEVNSKLDASLADNSVLDVSESIAKKYINYAIPEKKELTENINFDSKETKSNVNFFDSSSESALLSKSTLIDVEKNSSKQKSSLVRTMNISKLPTITGSKYTCVKSPSIENQCLNHTLSLKSSSTFSKIPRKLPEKLLLNINN